MTISLYAYFDQEYDEGRLPIAEEKKPRILHLPEAGNGILKRRLRGDRNQCPTCREYFKSSNAFDQHRVGVIGINRGCLTTAEMHVGNFGKTGDGFWCSPVAPKDRDRLNYIRAKGKVKQHAKETESF